MKLVSPRAVSAAAGSLLVSAATLAQPSAGLVGHWNFDEGAGTAISDSSPFANNGTLINGASAWTPGKHGTGLYFDGSARTEVRIPATASISSFSSVTFAAWVNSAEPNRDSPIFAKEGSNVMSYWVGVIGNQFGMLLSPNGTTWPTIEASRRQGGVPANQWTHLAASWDGTTMRMYENGFLIGSYPYAQSVFNGTGYLSIGVNSLFNNTQFHGMLDDAYLYNRALNAEEIASLMGTPACPEVYADTFAPPSDQWSNSVGNWTAFNGTYYPLAASNNPKTYSGLPFDLRDFEVSVQVNNFTDGGVWLRSDGTNRNGILLITGGGGYGSGNRSPSAGSRLYFHHVVNGVEGGELASSGIIVTPGTTHTLRVVVTGTSYAAFLDGAITPATLLNDTSYTHGHVGLYGAQPMPASGGSGLPQTFSDFSVTDYSQTVGSGIAQQPASIATCTTGDVAFSVTPSGAGPFTYSWQMETAPDTWIAVHTGALPYNGGTIIASSVETAHLGLALNVLPGAPALRFRCIVSNACGSLTSLPASLNFCIADFNCDHAVDFFDYLDFVSEFASGSAGADFNHDDVVDFFDYLDFVNALANGC